MKRWWMFPILVVPAVLLAQNPVPVPAPAPVPTEQAPMTNRSLSVFVAQDDPFEEQVIVAQAQPKVVTAPGTRVVTAEGGNVMYYRRMPGGPRWWKDSDLAQKVGVNEGQVQQMENIFQENRMKLIDLKAALEKQEARLEPLMESDNPDEGLIASQIDKVAGARADLEKANALMLVSIRRVLTTEQWKKLQAVQPKLPMVRTMGMGQMNFTVPLPPPPPGVPAAAPAPPSPPSSQSPRL